MIGIATEVFNSMNKYCFAFREGSPIYSKFSWISCDVHVISTRFYRNIIFFCNFVAEGNLLHEEVFILYMVVINLLARSKGGTSVVKATANFRGDFRNLQCDSVVGRIAGFKILSKMKNGLYIVAR